MKSQGIWIWILSGNPELYPVDFAVISDGCIINLFTKLLAYYHRIYIL